MPLCSKPYIRTGAQPCPCGQCHGCLTNRKQLWTHRNILESYNHEASSFVTLTYTDEHLPLNGKGIPTLRKEDLQLFLKRLRKHFPPKSVRYYAVGEYGTAGSRGINPHFHLCLYGVGEEKHRIIQDVWRKPSKFGKRGDPLGFTYTGSFTPQSAAYVAGYVQKKTKYNKDMYDEFEILPEFSTMSLRPAIGYNAVSLIAAALQENPEAFTPTGDVPTSLMHGSRRLPLGNYLREKIREELGLDHTLETWVDPITGEIEEKRKWHGKEIQKEIYRQELSDLQKNTQEDQKLPKDAQASIKHALQYRDGQAILNFEAKQKLKSKSGVL
jgi:hypothetical protein